MRADDRDLHEPTEHMGQWQEQQESDLRPAQDLGHVGADVDAQVHQVAVAELDALGTARGARRVDDRRQGLRGQGRAALVELGGLHEPQDVLALHAQDAQVRQLGHGGGQSADHRGHGLVLHDHELHPGVGEDPLGLIGR